MQNLATNVLIIGRSGAGKSTLLNYMFQREIEKTGCGKPVTQKGIFVHEYVYDDTLKIRIHDTWGLEPDKSSEWEKIITEEVEKHEKKEIAEWFNTIIFCISANVQRVEEFELQIMRSLLDGQNNIVVAITHCKSESDKEAEILRKRIVEETTLKKENIIFVNSIEKKLIGGKENSSFGRIAIFESIINNLWESFKQKVPARVKSEWKSEYHEACERFMQMLDEQHFIVRRDKKLKEFEDDFNKEIERFVGRAIEKIDRRFKDAVEYYNELSKKYLEIQLLDFKEFAGNSYWKFEVEEEFRLKVEPKIRDFQNACKAVFGRQITSMEDMRDLWVEVRKLCSRPKIIKRDLKDAVTKYLKKVNSYIERKISEIESEIKKTDISLAYSQQLESTRNHLAH